MYLETERKLHTVSIGALALSVLVVLSTRVQLIPSDVFKTLARAIGSGTAAAIAETIFLQLVTALICVVPLKLTRNRLSALDCLLLGGIAMAPTLASTACQPLGWLWLTIATAPLTFMLSFWAFKNVPPVSWLDAFYNDQEPWLSTVLTAMFAIQIAPMFILATGEGPLLRLSILLPLAGAVLAMLARGLDERPFLTAAAVLFLVNLAVFFSAWNKHPDLFLFSCPAT